MFQFKIIIFFSILLLVGCDSRQHLDVSAEVPATENIAKPFDVATLLSVPGDVAQGKLIAQQKCASCHGKQGVSGRVGAPFIAGQPYDYQIYAMVAYAEGQRDHFAMKEAVDTLDSQALADVSRYYASLMNVKWDPSVASSQTSRLTINSKTIAEGKGISKSCGSCHGKEGVSSRSGMPSLAGMHGEYFVKTLQAFFVGDRPHDIMAMFSGSVPEQSAESLAAYYATIKPKKAKTTIAGNVGAGRKIAIRQCAGCHGVDGNSIAPLMPSLAGQESAYLVKTTLDYRNAVRKDEMMIAAVKGMTDKQIEDVSAYFASQRPDPYVRVTAFSKASFKPLANASKIAKSCDGCHGGNGNSKKAGMPSLTGLTPEYLVASTLSYRNGERQDKDMALLLEDMSDLEVETISYYYATQKTQSSNMVGKGDVVEGEKQSAICAGCHDKVGADPMMPTLAGQNAAYTIQASKDYISGKRKHKLMADAVVVLPETVLVNIAAYYATLTPVRLNIRLPEAPAVLAANCDACHGVKGRSTTAEVPRLAGQVESYLARVLREYGTGERTSSPMHVNSIVLTQLESRAIASYYAAQ